jgi:fucose 4-O-acetylase-like acetyltransferase
LENQHSGGGEISPIFIMINVVFAIIKYLPQIPYTSESILESFVLVTPRSLLILMAFAYMLYKINLPTALRKFLAWFGKYSLNIYLLHVLVQKLLVNLLVLDSMLAYSIGVGCSFILAPYVDKLGRVFCYQVNKLWTIN